MIHPFSAAARVSNSRPLGQAVLLVLAFTCSASHTQANVCSAPSLGAPCAMGGAATMGAAEPQPALLLGNPVHLATGNKYQLDVDLPSNPASPTLELVRHYNGLSTHDGPLGRNWTLSYDTRLLQHADGWHVRQADGSMRKIPPPVPVGDERVWVWPNGRRLHFDAAGRLVRIGAGNALLLRITHHSGASPFAGLIHRVEGASGHALHFRYERHQGQVVLAAVDTPLGRFRYRHELPPADSGHRALRLASVERPDGMQRHYLYEPEFQNGNPYALTGIALDAPGIGKGRLTTWKYDPDGRVIELHRHGGRQPVLRVDYLQAAVGGRSGLTRIRSSNGREQRVRFLRSGNAYRLLERHTPGQTDGSPIVHDRAGRLAAMGGLTLRRDVAGVLQGVDADETGWPQLFLRRQRDRYDWHTKSTGMTTILVDSRARPILRRHANGDALRLEHDPQGRPVLLEETSSAGANAVVARLHWRGPRLVRLHHPHETESRRYDEHGRVIERLVQRPGGPLSRNAVFRDGFRHDGHGRVVEHLLPEGGALRYTWHGGDAPGGRLAALHWVDLEGTVHRVLTSSAAGYRHGNGLEMVSGSVSGTQVDSLRLSHGKGDVWLQRRRYDAHGRLTSDRHAFPRAGHHDVTHFAHDDASRLAGAYRPSPDGGERWWYAWSDEGGLSAIDRNGSSERPVIRRDDSGLPLEADGLLLTYGPGRRLSAVTHAGSRRVLAEYRHNAFGHRIAKEHAGRLTHYLHTDGHISAEASSEIPGEAPRIERRYIRAGLTPVGMIEYPQGSPPRLYAVHADLSGAPRLVTDAERRVRWQASYTPTGQAVRLAGDIDFPLRLPGQYEDEETGWHDNGLRTYAPRLGQYLEPDPLGPLPGTSAYGYAAQQPWRYADPDGLLLFAFDGTRYSADTMGNVWKLSQAYRDGAAHYHSGPGNSHFLDWDAIVAWRAGRILENQWQALLTAIEHQPAGSALPIDIIGFSRGAALARHFGNRVANHVNNGVFSVVDPLRGQLSACVDLRFMGLFDTVAQFGVAGSHNHLYDLGIAELWSWVSHAVALHEHRWAFPLTSADAGNAGNVVEAPFVGAHADIGGGLALYSPPSGASTQHDSVPGTGAEPRSDLAGIALAWMHWQALAANVAFDALTASDTASEAPKLRDMRSPFLRSVQAGDRAVLSPSGTTRHAYQEHDPRLGAAPRAATERFIDRPENWRAQAGEEVGVVDMAGYSRWLEETLGWQAR